MKVDFHFFKFDPFDWMNGVTQLLSLDEKGAFMDLCCRAFMNFGEICDDELLPALLHIDEGAFMRYKGAFLRLKLIECKDGVLSVKMIKKSFEDEIEYRKKCAEFGAMKNTKKKGASANKNREQRTENREHIEKEDTKKKLTDDENSVVSTRCDAEKVIAMAAAVMSPHIPSIECAHEFVSQFATRHPELHGALPQNDVMRELPTFVLSWDNREQERRNFG